MKKFYLILLVIMNMFSIGNTNISKLAYDFTFQGLEENTINIKDYKNKVILVVNVASRCGFTNQYEGLQSLWEKYNNDLIVIGVPTNNFKQEPGKESDIKSFCETNFGITFPMTKKINVIGGDAHPFYKWAKDNYGIGAIPKWNFHKIIINKKGNISNTFSSITKPTSLKFIKFIEKEIKS